MTQLLTPSGYRDIALCSVGDRVVGAGGRINRIESIQKVDTDEWQRWHAHKEVPDFLSYRVNDDFELFSEQSIFHNAGHVTHARLLRPGHVVFHRGKPVRVKRIRAIDGRPWHRLDIDGDHSYIGDGLRLHNASRFWVGGTGSITAINTASWSGSSGGGGGSSVPGSADAATLDGSSGGGTVTMNFGGTWTIQSLTMGAFTGTWDNSANNNNITCNATGGFSGSGSGARTIKLGSATYLLTSVGGSGTSALWQFNTTTNLTFDAGTSTISFSSNPVTIGRALAFTGGGLTYYALACAIGYVSDFQLNGANTFTSVTLTAPCYLIPAANTTQTITTLTASGTSSNSCGIVAANAGATLALTNLTAGWCFIRNMTFTGSGLTATNSMNGGNNSGITITPPATGGVSGSRIFSGM